MAQLKIPRRPRLDRGFNALRPWWGWPEDPAMVKRVVLLVIARIGEKRWYAAGLDIDGKEALD